MCHEVACSERGLRRRAEERFDVRVYGLILYLAFFLIGGGPVYQALYRKWRPSVFDDVVGQEHITSILKSEVSGGKISHAYLFCGPRGTGKTTCAKIIAKAANCEHPENGNPCGVCNACRAIDAGTTTDVIEMDAASNNGVDNIRDLRDGIIYTPADLKYRVYIIDEVHMLSISAFNALLKTLEEPPEHAIFILATTELHKIPATVLSRCQRFDFHRVPQNAIVSRLSAVCHGEGLSADNAALSVIARLSQGGMRDALNMLEYCAGEPGTITAERAERLLGTSSRAQLLSLAEAVAEKDTARALSVVDEVYLSSREIAVFWRELIAFYRDLLVAVATRMQNAADDELRAAASRYPLPTLLYCLEKMSDAESDMQKNPTGARLYAEMALIRACDSSLSPDLDALTERVATLEAKLVGGAVIAAPVSAPAPTPKPAPKKPETLSSDPKPAEEKRQPAAEKSNAQTSVRRAVKKWPEIVRRLSATEKLLVPFLQAASAFEEPNGRFSIEFESKFAVSLMTDARKNAVASAVNAVLGTSYQPDDVLCAARENVGGVRQPIEDLVEDNAAESLENS